MFKVGGEGDAILFLCSSLPTKVVQYDKGGGLYYYEDKYDDKYDVVDGEEHRDGKGGGGGGTTIYNYENKGREDAIRRDGGGRREEEELGGNLWVNPREQGGREIERRTRGRCSCRCLPEQKVQGELWKRRKQQCHSLTSALCDINACAQLCLLYIYDIN